MAVFQCSTVCSAISIGSAVLTGALGANTVLAQDTTRVGVVQDQYPAVSPDGRKIAFESNRAGPIDQIFVYDLDTEIVKQLTDSAEQNETPVWSPDGTKIAFARLSSDAPRPTWDVFEMNADGSDVRNLTQSPGHDDHPRYSPDGKTVVFNSARLTDFTQLSDQQLDSGDYNYEIFQLNIDGGRAIRLTHYHEWDTYPSVSPDGERLLWRRVYAEGGSGPSGRNSEILMSDRNGKNAQNLTNHAAFDGYPVWSPDGSYVAFASNRDGREPDEFNIYVTEIASGKVARITETVEDTEQVRPAWFPDGSSIVFNRDYPDGRSELHIVGVDAQVFTEE